MTNEAELAVKAHIWTVDQVGTLDSFLSTWIWLPYRVKEALAMSIKGGLLTMITPWNREWPHWTSAGLKSLSQLAEVPDENWHKGTPFGETFVAEAVEKVEECLDGMYLEEWAKIAGHPERVVDDCLGELRHFWQEGGIDIVYDTDVLEALGDFPQGLNEALDRVWDREYSHEEEHVEARESPTNAAAIEAAELIQSYHNIFESLMGPSTTYGESEYAHRVTPEETTITLHKVIELLTKAGEKNSDAASLATRLAEQEPHILRWVQTGECPQEIIGCQEVPKYEVGFELLCGRRLAQNEIEYLTWCDQPDEDYWLEVKSRLAKLQEEGNARFDALDATLMAKHVCNRKRNIGSIFDYYKGGPEGTAQAYCVKCREKVDIMGTGLFTLKSKRLTIIGTCPQCGIRVFRFVSRKGFEKGG